MKERTNDALILLLSLILMALYMVGWFSIFSHLKEVVSK